MSGRVIISGDYSGLENGMEMLLGKRRAVDPFSPIRIITGSNLLGGQLRKRLAGRIGELLNVHFLTLLDLVSLLESRKLLGAPGCLSEFESGIILEELLRSRYAPDFFNDRSGGGTAADSVLSCFTDLAEGGCNADAVSWIMSGKSHSSGLDERTLELISFYSRFRDVIGVRGGDIHSRFERAAEFARDEALGGLLIFYGFYDFNEAQWKLIEELSGKNEAIFFVPCSSGGRDGFTGRTLRRLADRLADGDAVRSEPAGRSPAEIRLFSAIDAEEEVREIVRRILGLVRQDGYRFSEVAVVIHSWDEYWPLMREILGEAEIPYRADESMLSGKSPASESALRLLQLVGGELERWKLVDFISSAPLEIPESWNFSYDPYSLWIKNSASAGMTGEGGWVAESGELVERLESSTDGDGEGAEAVASAVIMCEVIGSIEHAKASMGGEHGWRHYARTFTECLEDLFVECEDTMLTCAAINRLEDLDRISGPVSFDTFSRHVRTVLASSRVKSVPEGASGIKVLRSSRARGLLFRAVFLPGITESALPGRIRQDPFLKDDERVILNRSSGGRVMLSLKGDRLDEEKLVFELELNSAEEVVVLSYPEREMGTGKELTPSSFLRTVEGYSPDGNHDGCLGFKRLPPRRGSPLPPDPVSIHECRYLLASGRTGGPSLPPADRFISRGAELVMARWGRRAFTPYDGVFSSGRALEELGKILGEKGRSFSPTSLESYAKCPFSYFLKHILRIESIEEPERLISITPLQRGIIVHELLAGLYRDLEAAGLLPIRERDRERVLDMAREAASCAFSGYLKANPVGLPVFWSWEKGNMMTGVRLMLDEEMRAGEDYVPYSFECGFGALGDVGGAPVGLKDCGVFFHGRIDRIDMRSDGRYRVIDYKTGGLNRMKDQDLAGGAALQLPVYLLAASVLLGSPVSRGVAMYRRVGAGSGKRLVTFSGELWDDDGGDFERLIGCLVGGIEECMFFPLPDRETCKYCDMKSACPSGRDRLFDMKIDGDRRVGAYQESIKRCRTGG